MSVTNLDLEIYRGDDYTHTINFSNDADPPTGINLSAYTFKAEIRDRPENSTNILAEFTIDDTNSASGTIILSLTAAETRIPPGYWDLQLSDGVSTKTWLKGQVRMEGEVTV